MNRGSLQATGIALGGLTALAAAVGIGRFVYTPILPYMLDGLGLSKAEGGLLASANFLGYLLGALAASAVALPGGQRGWFLSALALSALTTAAMGIHPHMALFLGLRFAGGVASAFVLVLSSALILDRLAALRRPALSAVHFAGVGSGIAMSALLVSEMAALGHGWRMLWFASGAVSLLALGAALWLVPREQSVARPAAPSRGAHTNRRLIALIVAYGLFGFGYVITATFISTMVRATPEIRSIEPQVWLVVGLAAVPSVALWTWIGRRLGNDRSFAIACIVEAAGVVMSVLATGALAIVLSAAMLGGTFMGLTALGLIHARDISNGDPRRSLGLMTAAFGLGQMIAPTLAGIVYDLSGSLLLPSLAAAAGLLISAGLVTRTRA
ncbi:MAG: YbfB/YjiJ family MFS transporter [SAR324 cluster bacterium]|nr:YbfB/YjiJ family MFS transporter [SAR324 cluster bacterium]